jgi:hypothetical protein
MQTLVIQIGSRMPLTDDSVPERIPQAVLQKEQANKRWLLICEWIGGPTNTSNCTGKSKMEVHHAQQISEEDL